MAFSADDLGLDGDLLADGQRLAVAAACDSGADPDDLAGDLMTLGDGIFGERVLAVVDVDIGTADADLLDFDQHLIGGDLRDGDFAELDLSGCCHDLLQHTIAPFPCAKAGFLFSL